MNHAQIDLARRETSGYSSPVATAGDRATPSSGAAWGHVARASMSRRDRRLAAATAVGLAVLFGVAAWLRPDSRGYGTHQQLGFPPCTFTVLFGIHCPTCGTTTAWAHFVRGRWPSALRANVAGTVLALVAMAVAVWLGVSAARGRWWIRPPGATLVGWLVGVWFAASVVEWCIRLLIGS